jgi:hypothetical protein
MTRKMDIRTPRGRLEILDIVSGVGGRARPRMALRERTLLLNARNLGKATAKGEWGGEKVVGGDRGRGSGKEEEVGG